MAIRTAKAYQGEDMSPIYDYTDYVIWEESEFGTRAWRGEGNGSSIVIRDPLGEQGNASGLPSGLTAKSLAAHNLFVVTLGSDTMFRGRVGIKNYSRDDQRVERYRQVECNLHDTNWDLDHIFVHNYTRPAETDTARIQGLIASYLQASPRPTTSLNGSNYLSGSNTVALPAKTYTRTSPLNIIREIAETANKQFFVTGDSLLGGSLFYDGNDSTVYQAGIRISDRPNEINTSIVCGGSGSAQIVDTVGAEETIGVLGWVLDFINFATLTNPAIYVAYGFRDDDPPADPVITWRNTGGTVLGTFTKVVESRPAGTLSRCDIWRLLNPDPAGDRINSTTQNIGYWVLENVDQTTPEAATASNSGTSTTPSVNISGPGGALVLRAFHTFNVDGNPTANPTVTNQTQDWADFGDAAPGFGDQEFAGAHSTPGSAGWTLSGGSQPWAAVAVAVNVSSLGSESATFPPIWNVGPASTEDGAELLDEVVLFYGTGESSYVTAHSTSVHTLYGHTSETFSDDTVVSAAEAQTKANAILAYRRYEDKTYNVTIGPLTDAQVLCVKHGQLIQIKARAIPDADDQFRTMRIVQCRYTTPVVGTWFAHMQLGRPWKMQPYPKGPILTPSAAGSLDPPAALGDAADPGEDTGVFANADHVHPHGTFTTSDYHSEYVREAILTTAGDMPYASAASTWTRRGIGASNWHLVSDGAVPLWAPQGAGGGMTNPMTTAGDIIKGGAAGTPERLAIGASNTHLISDGAQPLWVANSGGGGGGAGNVVAEPTGSTITIPGLAIADREPASPDGSDDEFDTADTDPIAGWTTLGTPDVMDTNTTSPSHLYIKQNAQAAVNFEGLYKAKSPAFTVRAKLSGTTHRTSFQTACLFIGEASPGKIEFISLRNQSIDYVPLIGVYAFTTPTGTGSVVNNTAIQMHAPVYFKIVVASSTDVSYYYGSGAMPDGGPWTPITLARNPGFTVGSVGLAVESENGTHAIEGLFDWIRFG